MATCFIRSSVLPGKFRISSNTSHLKFYTCFSPIYNNVSSSSCIPYQHTCKKLNNPKQVQFRNFSLNGFSNFYDVVSNSDESKAVTDFMVQFHDITGLPWWGAIISATLTMKLFISLPCGVWQQHIASKIELSKTELDSMAGGIKHKVLLEARKRKWTEQKTRFELNSEFINYYLDNKLCSMSSNVPEFIRIRKQWKVLMVKNNCHPFKNFILFIAQFPVWLMMTLSIRKFAADATAMSVEHPVAALQFLVGGPFWCQNLAMPDPKYILPALNAIAILGVTELNLLQAQLKTANKKQNFLFRAILPNFFRLLALVFFMVSSASASGVSLFWASSSLFALVQNLLLMSPRMRRLLRIPKTPTDLTRPYSQMWAAFLEKWPKSFSRK